ncbi:MAG TPA: hypothetical protein VLR90_16150 [Blastocatellia bacterium]|nr:hypothetical protein [Blastocatellia bacterium]
MLLSTQMITGFNTDVRYEGRVYHVQTEDRGQDNPFLESLVYIGGTIVAKKSTPYLEQLSKGATEEMIASLLKRQHQVIIAAIKAGRIEDLIRHSAKVESLKELKPKQSKPKSPSGKLPAPPAEQPQPALQSPPPARADVKTTALLGRSRQVEPPPVPTPVPGEREALKGRTAPLGSPAFLKELTQPKKPANFEAPSTSSSNQNSNVAGLDLDQVISDYLKRNSEQGKLELKVITPSHFIAGKNIGLRVQVEYGPDPEPEAVVTIKVIGTAFKPQVYIGRAGRDGVASFGLSLPSFTAGTAAIVIEAQSGHGRGELKHLIRRA